MHWRNNILWESALECRSFMSLPAGTRLGPYEILSPLGAGGMGGAYPARDTGLGRDVALKVLAESLAHDPERDSPVGRGAPPALSLSRPHLLGVIPGRKH